MKTIALVLAAIILAAGASPAASQGTSALGAVLAATDWLNARPNQADLRGKVVLLDFYTFDCYNCKNVQPNLRTLYKNIPRTDLVILSVHSPETAFEHSRRALIASMRDQGVVWPVAVDNDFAIWNAYAINAWPTQLIFDRNGVLRKTIVGDSQDAEVDATIKSLIAERSKA